ncbi:histidine kinase dimerization/phospho-acceptor domain-containing protein [Nostoc sp. CALU 1950]|uniref:histidine kinase dimerization/phospho-acceptor domain-containing protein n=1 Tax=Nostoc sp. CALU 1950 TaxID=3104321 RepID=UPI003EB6ABCB
MGRLAKWSDWCGLGRINKCLQSTTNYFSNNLLDSLTDSQQEALEMAVSEADHMTQILQNLLDLARASHSMMPLQPELLLLNYLVADIV